MKFVIKTKLSQDDVSAQTAGIGRVFWILFFLLTVNLCHAEITVNQAQLTLNNSLQEKAKNALLNQLGSQYTRVEIKPLSHLKDSEYPLDTFKTEIISSYPTAKRVCVWLIHEKQRIAVWFTVSAYAHVWVATRHLQANTPVQNNSFNWQERDIAGLREKPAQTLPPHYWLKSSLDENKILLVSQIKEPPLVMRGQQVKVNVQNHGVNLFIDAVALTDGYLGQMIRIKNPLNQQIFMARVNGASETEIILSSSKAQTNDEVIL